MSLPSFRTACLALLVVAVSATTAACTDAPGETRTLRIGNQAEPASLDPHRSEGIPARNIQRDLFEGLVGEDRHGDIVRGVARAWETSADGLTWTFHLDPEARWSNGDAVTANDFVFSLRRAVTPETGGIVSETLLPIRHAAAILRGDAAPETLGVRAIDPHTLVIELHAPTPYFLALLTHPSTFPVHPGSVRANGNDWTEAGRMISNGAYRLVEWQVNSHIALEKNPHYRNADNVDIARIEYLPVDDQRAELARFEAGDIHITYGVPPGRVDWLREHFPEELNIHPWFGVYYLGLNVTRPPLDDVRVRRALSLAIDRELLAGKIAGTGETPAWNWIPPLGEREPVLPEWADWPREERVAAARRLLHAAGYDDRTPLQLEILYNNRDRDQRIVTAIAAMWRDALGVKATLVNREWKVYLQTRRQPEQTQVFRSGWIADYHDPNGFAEILHSEHGMNESGWHNNRYDALIEQAATTRDPDERSRLFTAADELVQAEVPLIPLFHYASARLVSNAVEGYTGNIMDHHYTRHLAWRRLQ